MHKTYLTFLAAAGCLTLSACGASSKASSNADQARHAVVAIGQEGLAPGTIGLAFTYFWYDMHETPQDCPEGYAYALRDLAILHLPKERQEFLLRAENRSDYYRMGYALSGRHM